MNCDMNKIIQKITSRNIFFQHKKTKKFYLHKLILTLLVIEQLHSFLHGLKAQMIIFQNIPKLYKLNKMMKNYNQIELVYDMKEFTI